MIARPTLYSEATSMPIQYYKRVLQGRAESAEAVPMYSYSPRGGLGVSAAQEWSRAEACFRGAFLASSKSRR